jgi:hypothetical protein
MSLSKFSLRPRFARSGGHEDGVGTSERNLP